MKKEIFEEIKLLIEEKMGKYEKKIDRDTSLEKDLGISGDDAWELIMDFSRKFNVDISNFEFSKYFYPEGDSILPSIIRAIRGKPSPKHRELLIGDLERSVIKGKLDEIIINDIS